MKYDSYPRFLKSDIYKNCIRTEMEDKSIPYSKTNEEKPNHFVRQSKQKERCFFLNLLVLGETERRREKRQKTKSFSTLDER